MQYISPDGTQNDIHIKDLLTGQGSYSWKSNGETAENVTSDVTLVPDYDYQAMNYMFKADNITIYELRLKIDGNSISIIFKNSDLYNQDYVQQVQSLISASTSHLFVTDNEGNTSADLLHTGE